MLCLPVFFDQHHNAAALEWRGVARVLEPVAITTPRLVSELSLLLADNNS